MIASVINAALVLLGSVVGLVFKNKIKKKYTDSILMAMALAVAMIGISNAIKTQNVLCVIICMAVGTVIGEALNIEKHLDGLGNRLKAKVTKGDGDSRFAEGFMGATLLFCVGSMAIMGSMDAGINHNYEIILSKSVIDCISAVTFAAAMGVGVAFSALGVLLYQGLLTLAFMLLGPVIPDAAIVEMTAVGGLLIMSLAVNMLGLMGERRIPVGNMLPAVFLPLAYIPVSKLISSLF